MHTRKSLTFTLEGRRERRPVPQRAPKAGASRYYEDDRAGRGEVQNAKQATLSNRSISESVQVCVVSFQFTIMSEILVIKYLHMYKNMSTSI